MFCGGIVHHVTFVGDKIISSITTIDNYFKSITEALLFIDCCKKTITSSDQIEFLCVLEV